MLEPFGISVGILTILETTQEVVKYVREVTKAPAERAQFVAEAQNLYYLFIRLKSCIENADLAGKDEEWVRDIRVLNASGGAFHQYCEHLKQLRKEFIGDVDSSKEFSQRLRSQLTHGKAAQRILWPFRKEQFNDILACMERVKVLVLIALEMGHL